MNVLNTDINCTDLHAVQVAAESVRRIVGHSELCRKRPITDLSKVSTSFHFLKAKNHTKILRSQ
jgi:hypothetical protein